MPHSPDDQEGKAARCSRSDALERELRTAEIALRKDVQALLADPPPDVVTVTTLLDAMVAPTVDSPTTKRLIQFVDADRPATPALVALGLQRRPGLVQTHFPHRFAWGVVAHTSPPNVPLDELNPPILKFGCVPDHYQRVIRRIKAVRAILAVMEERAALTAMELTDAQLGNALRARALTESLAYDSSLGRDVVAIFIEELVVTVMVEVEMLQQLLDVATGPIQREGRLRLATVVPEIIEVALSATPRPDPGASKLLRMGLPGARPQFFLGRWRDDLFAHTARGVSSYMQALTAAA